MIFVFHVFIMEVYGIIFMCLCPPRKADRQRVVFKHDCHATSHISDQTETFGLLVAKEIEKQNGFRSRKRKILYRKYPFMYWRTILFL